MWREKYQSEVFKVQGDQQTIAVLKYFSRLPEKIIESRDMKQTQTHWNDKPEFNNYEGSFTSRNVFPHHDFVHVTTIFRKFLTIKQFLKPRKLMIKSWVIMTILLRNTMLERSFLIFQVTFWPIMKSHC